jgi:hypothetical protein
MVKRGAADSDLKRYGSLAVGERYAGEEAIAQTFPIDRKLSTKEVDLDLHSFPGCACTHLEAKARHHPAPPGHATGI